MYSFRHTSPARLSQAKPSQLSHTHHRHNENKKRKTTRGIKIIIKLFSCFYINEENKSIILKKKIQKIISLFF